jgi:hypothetical protein
MECEAVRQEFDRGKRLLVTDVGSLGGKVLDVVDYFDSLPKSWDIHYFHSGTELREAVEKDEIQANSLVVLPTDEDLEPGQVYAFAVRRGIKVFIIVGVRTLHLEHRDRLFYLI